MNNAMLITRCEKCEQGTFCTILNPYVCNNFATAIDSISIKNIEITINENIDVVMS